MEDVGDLEGRQMPRGFEQFSAAMGSRIWGLPDKMDAEEKQAAERADSLVPGLVQTARTGGDVETYLRVEAENRRRAVKDTA